MNVIRARGKAEEDRKREADEKEAILNLNRNKIYRLEKLKEINKKNQEKKDEAKARKALNDFRYHMRKVIG